jgi:prepilin-type N-terminal cleavage/methylation domain-containing protein
VLTQIILYFIYADKKWNILLRVNIFTLIELLIGILIIGILAAMLEFRTYENI